jgi:hypothetical protein
MAKSIKPMFAVFGPGGWIAQFDGFSDAEKLARHEACRNVGSNFVVLGAVVAFVADPPVVRTVEVQGSDYPTAAGPIAEDIIDYMEARAAAEAASPPADGWITWTGGDNPAPGKTVQCIMGGRQPAYVAEFQADGLRWDWRHGGTGSDITAYRVVRS